MRPPAVRVSESSSEDDMPPPPRVPRPLATRKETRQVFDNWLTKRKAPDGMSQMVNETYKKAAELPATQVQDRRPSRDKVASSSDSDSSSSSSDPSDEEDNRRAVLDLLSLSPPPASTSKASAPPPPTTSGGLPTVRRTYPNAKKRKSSITVAPLKAKRTRRKANPAPPANAAVVKRADRPTAYDEGLPPKRETILPQPHFDSEGEAAVVRVKNKTCPPPPPTVVLKQPSPPTVVRVPSPPAIEPAVIELSSDEGDKERDEGQTRPTRETKHTPSHHKPHSILDMQLQSLFTTARQYITQHQSSHKECTKYNAIEQSMQCHLSFIDVAMGDDGEVRVGGNDMRVGNVKEEETKAEEEVARSTKKSKKDRKSNHDKMTPPQLTELMSSQQVRAVDDQMFLSSIPRPPGPSPTAHPSTSIIAPNPLGAIRATFPLPPQHAHKGGLLPPPLPAFDFRGSHGGTMPTGGANGDNGNMGGAAGPSWQQSGGGVGAPTAGPPRPIRGLMLHRPWVANPTAARNPPGGISFRIMTYNMLAQSIIPTTPELYPQWHYPDRSVLEWRGRWSLIRAEIERHCPSILCAQEMDEEKYDMDLAPFLRSQGYSSVFKRRTGGKFDGCATAWLNSVFVCEDLEDQRHCRHITFNGLPKTVYDHEQIATIVALRPRRQAVNRPPLIVANTHLLFNPRRGDSKLAQFTMMMAHINDMLSLHNNSPSGNALLMCGDYNLVPRSPIYSLITQKSLTFEHVFASELSGQLSNRSARRGRQLGRTLLPPTCGVSESCHLVSTDGPPAPHREGTGKISHGNSLVSVYRHANEVTRQFECSTYHAQDGSMVDYIFYGVHSSTPQPGQLLGQSVNVVEERLRLIRHVQLPSREQLSQTCGVMPNSQQGSDHLPLIAEFVLQ